MKDGVPVGVVWSSCVPGGLSGTNTSNRHVLQTSSPPRTAGSAKAVLYLVSETALFPRTSHATGVCVCVR